MLYTMYAVGSLGDVSPYIALGKELKKRGNEVRIAAFEPFSAFVSKSGLLFHALPGSVDALMKSAMRPHANPLMYLRHATSYLAAHTDEFMLSAQKAAEDADVIICTFFGGVFYSIAEAKGIPLIQTQYYPMDQTSQLRVTVAPKIPLNNRVYNYITYNIAYGMIRHIEKKYLGEYYRKSGLHMRRRKMHPDYMLAGKPVPVLYAVSPTLLPRPASWRENIHITGFWHDSDDIDFIPPPALEDYLSAGEPPIYIGFGSMVSDDMRNVLETFVTAVGRLGIRAVFSKELAKCGIDTPPDCSCLTDFVPHSWLFKRVKAVVHHGGAGTLSAGLLAGKPTLVIPFGGDQPFWGERIYAMGLGPKPLYRTKLSASRVQARLDSLINSDEFSMNAKKAAEKLAKENGVTVAADIIESSVGAEA
ncbi:MAG: glycosyltransferase [Eubacteriales bacterium]|nr:glycosyltransferase [Eubacteriales bacterium]MDD3881529.1 glycosyltransferase [Eubacteriales bacterium]MDD4512989.1 glycosyltransferase [Eubacteriales bacterium]